MTITKINLLAFSLFFTVAGALHFFNSGFYLKMMPSYLPYHLELVYLSGIAESFLGLAVLITKYRKIVCYGVILLLIAVFPANIFMLTEKLKGNFPETPIMLLYLRLPFQFLFIYWAYRVSKIEN